MKWLNTILIKQTVKKTVPIKTWNPLNPVAKKKVEPYIESLIVKLALTYSNAWKHVKIIANILHLYNDINI